MSLADFINTETMTSPAASPSPVRGVGGGLADAVPAVVDGEQPAALSEGEFVIPADVVSMLGDGSSEAGARILTSLLDRIRAAKQEGNKEQAGTITEGLS